DFWVALAVAADVGKPGRALGVSPEIGRLAHIVMPVAAWRRGCFCSHRKRTGCERFLRFCLELAERLEKALVARPNPLSSCFQGNPIENKPASLLGLHSPQGSSGPRQPQKQDDEMGNY